MEGSLVKPVFSSTCQWDRASSQSLTVSMCPQEHQSWILSSCIHSWHCHTASSKCTVCTCVWVSTSSVTVSEREHEHPMMKTLITAERLFPHHRFANLSLLSNLAPSLPLTISLTHSFAWKHTYNQLAQRTSLSLPRVTMTTGCCEHLAKLPNTHPAVLMPVDCPSLLVTHALWFISQQSKRHSPQYRHSFWPNGACCHTFAPFRMLWSYTFLVLESDTVWDHVESFYRFLMTTGSTRILF